MTTHNVSSCTDISEPSFIVLCSAEHYRWWFLETYDVSCFSEDDLNAYFTETMPTEFPCIPWYGDESSVYPEAFISVNLLKKWMSFLKDSENNAPPNSRP